MTEMIILAIELRVLKMNDVFAFALTCLLRDTVRVNPNPHP